MQHERQEPHQATTSKWAAPGAERTKHLFQANRRDVLSRIVNRNSECRDYAPCPPRHSGVRVNGMLTGPEQIAFAHRARIGGTP